MMDNDSFSEADFPGKRCLFSESSLLSVLSALSHAGICGVCVQRSWGVAASSQCPKSPHPALLLPFPSRCRPCPCLERWEEQHLEVLFLETLPRLALDAFVDQSRRTGFHVDPADPSARRFQEVERTGSREVSWEPTKTDHQRCLVFAGSWIAERLNDSERMFHLKEVCFPAWLCISKPLLCCGPALVSKGPKCSVFDGFQAQDCLGCGSELHSRVMAVPALVPPNPWL